MCDDDCAPGKEDPEFIKKQILLLEPEDEGEELEDLEEEEEEVVEEVEEMVEEVEEMGEEVEEIVEEEEEPMDAEDGEYIEEEETGSPYFEGDFVEEEEDTLNANTTLDHDLTTIEEEGSSLDEDDPPTVKKSPSAEEKRPIPEKRFSAIIKKYPAFQVDYVDVMENHPTVEIESAIMKDDPAIEVEYLSFLERLIQETIEKGQSSKGMGLAATPSAKGAPAEKQCQTIEQEYTYKEISFDEEEPEISFAGQGLFDRACQTTSVADNRPVPIDREMQTTENLDSISPSSSPNAFKENDSGNTLTDCPSIEEESLPEPIKIAQVEAQVMVRNDSTGGWVPEGRGGMSTVVISKTLVPRNPDDDTPVANKYTIKGKRIEDKRDNLDCTIKKEFDYKKVMPTFHHWISGGERFGLTFLSTREARNFDEGLRGSVYSYMMELDPNARPLSFEGDGDENFLAFTEPAPPEPRTPSPEVNYDLPDYLLPNAEEEERLQFMQLTDLPEYYFQDLRGAPRVSDLRLRRRPLYRTRKPLKLFGLVRRTSRTRCKYCHELYEEEENTKGQCRYAPDPVKSVIDGLTCMCCAKVWVSDCMLDPDQSYSHPCTCRDDGYCGFRWFGLCILSIFLPCVLFYPPLKGCYDCGVYCQVCGGRHKEKIIPRVRRFCDDFYPDVTY